MQILTNTGLTIFVQNLTPVQNGEAYLRVAKDSQGNLTYDVEGKKSGFSGLIQYIVRFFDSSYNVNNAFTLLAKTFEQFKASPTLEKATASLLEIGEHINKKRFFRKIDLIPLQNQKIAITTQLATQALALKGGFKLEPPPVPRSSLPASGLASHLAANPIAKGPERREHPSVDLTSSIYATGLRGEKMHPPAMPASLPPVVPLPPAPIGRPKTRAHADDYSPLAKLLLSKTPASIDILREAEAQTARIFSDIENDFVKIPREKTRRLVSGDISLTFTPDEAKIRDSLFRLTYFITSTFKENPLLSLVDMVEGLYDDIKAKGVKWEQIKAEFLKAQAEVFSFAPNLVNHAPTWLHGSSLSMLPGAVRMVLPEGAPALVPTGMLLRHGYAPLTGEVSVGVSKGGINQHALSGVGPSYFDAALKYAYIPSFAFAERSALESILNTKSDFFIFERLKIMVLRLFLTDSISTHRDAIISHLTTLAGAFPKISKSDDWTKALGFLGMRESDVGSCIDPHGTINCGSVVLVPRSSGVPTLGIVRSIDEKYSEVIVNQDIAVKDCEISLLRKIDVSKLPKKLERSISKEGAEAIEEELLTMRENLDNLINIIKARPQAGSITKEYSPATPLTMSRDSSKMLNEHMPIVFASYTAKDFTRVRSDIKGELGLRGAQELGKDIQTLFCPEKDVGRVREWLGKKLGEYGTSMNVLSFEASYYLYAQNVVGVSLNGRPYFS